jgi:hypothetical protein
MDVTKPKGMQRKPAYSLQECLTLAGITQARWNKIISQHGHERPNPVFKSGIGHQGKDRYCKNEMLAFIKAHIS